MTATFTPPVAEVMKTLRDGVSKTHQSAAISFAQRVITRTPRRTGRLQYGWNYSTGSPDKTRPDEGRYPQKVIPLRFASGRPSQAYIWNTVPYVRFREYGGGMGAPRGMVQLTVRDWPYLVGRAAVTYFP